MSLNHNSSHYTAYYNHVNGMEHANDKLAKVYDIITDISDRRGLGDEWEEIDGEIQDEIIEKWLEIISI